MSTNASAKRTYYIDPIAGDDADSGTAKSRPWRSFATLNRLTLAPGDRVESVAPSTFLAMAGLDRAGYSDPADTIAERFCRLCDKSGFAENFDALTGEPLCDPAYTWTASVFLLLAERVNERG